MPDGDTIGKYYHGKKEEALSLMNKGLLGGGHKGYSLLAGRPMRGNRYGKYNKKGSNSQELPPTLNRQVYFT
jgi:hypothetical protein